MTKSKKVVIGTLIGIFTLGSVISLASPERHCGKFAGKGGDRMEFIINRISSKLELNEEQEKNLTMFKETLVEQKNKHRVDDRKEIIKNLLSEPVLDEGKVMSMMEERGSQMKQSAPKIVAALANFTNSLNDEQRSELIEITEKFDKHRGPFGRGIEQ